MYEKMLLAVDASGHSRPALSTAVEVARRFGSEVLVVHVREPVMAETGDHLETIREAAETAGWAEDCLKSAGIRARSEVRPATRGGVAREILAAADEFGAELIVMGSRGLSDLGGLLLGSVAHKVVQLSDRPVLIAR